MNRDTLRTLHKIAAICATLLIASFWGSTLISELFLSQSVVVMVKNAISYGVFLLIIAMAMTGATGFKMGGKSKHAKIVAKKKRMPIVAANGY